MNEEFAIKLKTIIDQSSISQTKQELANLKNEIQKSFGSITVVPKAKTSTIVKMFEDAEESVDSLKEKLKQLQDSPIRWIDGTGMSPKNQDLADKQNKEAVLERIRQINELEAEIARKEKESVFDTKQVANNVDELSENTGKAESSMSLFSKTTVTVKNTAKDIGRRIRGVIGALIGVTGVYAGIRKAMTTWLAQNDELQQKLNGAWYALGSLFAPILEWIINKFVYLVSLVDALVKSLGFAGVNMSKFGKKSGQASKQLAGFDEINNLNSQSGGGGGGSDFKLAPIADEALQKFRAILALVAGIGAGLLAWKLATTFMDALGWTQKECIGLGLAVGGVVAYVLAFADAWQNGLNLENLRVMLLGVTAVATGLFLLLGPTASAIALIVGGVGLLVLGIKEFIENGKLSENACLAITAGITLIGTAIGLLIGGPLGAIVAFITSVIIGGIVPLIMNNWEDIKAWFKTGLEAIKTWFVNTWNSIKTKTSELWNNLKNGVSNFFSSIGSTISSKVKSIINSYIINPINKVIGWINSALNFSYGGMQILGKQVIAPFSVNLGRLNSIPALASGTNYVPNDMLAQLHQGEAVVPKAFNEDQYNNSEETNDLLRELIDVVGSKEFRAYISQREIGEASLNYQRSKQRIMGGGLV